MNVLNYNSYHEFLEVEQNFCDEEDDSTSWDFTSTLLMRINNTEAVADIVFTSAYDYDHYEIVEVMEGDADEKDFEVELEKLEVSTYFQDFLHNAKIGDKFGEHEIIYNLAYIYD